MKHVTLCLILGAFVGCGGAPSARFPPGVPIHLLNGPTHLGDNRAGAQNFTSGQATAARVCSLINLPVNAEVNIQVVNLRNSETLSNLLTVNGKSFPLGVTLERDPREMSEVTSNSMQASPVFFVRLDAGPSEVCLVSGLRRNNDLDDFEVDQVVLYVQGIDPAAVGVRRGLELGTPQPTQPPSRPWGQQQGP